MKLPHALNRCAIALTLATTLGAQTPVKPAPATGPSAAKPAALIAPCPPSDADCVPPAVSREFRGVWVATARNTDWPSKPGLPTAQQQEELLAILDRARSEEHTSELQSH